MERLWPPPAVALTGCQSHVPKSANTRSGGKNLTYSYQQQRHFQHVPATNNEAAFHFELTIKHENGGMVIAPIDVMTFNDEGKISSMRAFWTQDDIKQL